MDSLGLFEHASNQYNGLWTLYVTVAFGALAFSFTETYQGSLAGGRGRILFTLVYILFVMTNCWSLIRNAETQKLAIQRMRTSQELGAPDEKVSLDREWMTLLDGLNPPSSYLIVTMQVIGASAVVFALYRRGASTARPEESVIGGLRR